MLGKLQSWTNTTITVDSSDWQSLNNTGFENYPTTFDSTYDEYIITITSVQPATDTSDLLEN